jgi:addiction module RelE/StbE family toxin
MQINNFIINETIDGTYKLKFVLKAQDDLTQIFDYIFMSLSAPIVAENLIDKIKKGCKRLSAHPYSCPILHDDVFSKKGYRLLVVDNFIIFYQIDESNLIVRVMWVIYGKRKYQLLM